MKKLSVVLLAFVALVACNQPQNKSAENAEEQTSSEVALVGADKEDHGCIASAGETWSQLLQSCVRLFEAAQRLNPIETPEGEAVISAFVLVNEEQTQAELFVVDVIGGILLDKAEGDVFQNGEYSYNSQEQVLYKQGEKVFAAE